MARTRQSDEVAQQVETTALSEIEEGGVSYAVKLENLLPTGCTLSNLALSDCPGGGYGIGTMDNLIGDSNSGKTLAALTMFAEMAQDPRFDDYRLIYDDAEAALAFDLAGVFGKKAASRIESPNGKPISIHGDGEIDASDTIQSFQGNVLNVIKAGKPFVYILDSFDAITSDEEIEKADDRAEGKAVSGSYGMEKAKMMGQTFRLITRHLKKTKSFLLVISQVRDNVDPMAFEKKRRSGGRALKFYATHEMWLASLKKITSKERVIGNIVEMKCTKNKLTGKIRSVKYPVFYTYGIDDIGACIDFMVEEEKWKAPSKLNINAPDFEFNGTRAKLIELIEEDGLQGKLQQVVAAAWLEIEEHVKVKRKAKYE